MATTNKTEQPLTVGPEKSNPRFGKPLLTDEITDTLRRKHVSESGLTIEESRQLILAANERHVERLERFGVIPLERYKKLLEGKADYLVVGCSDSRLLKLDSEDDPLIGIQVRVAANVIPRPGTPSFDEIRAAVSQVRPDGIVIIQGHIKCGGVNEHVKWVKGGKKDTGSEPLNELMRTVSGHTPEENAKVQAEAAKGLLGVGKREVAAVVYDWDNGHFDILSGKPTPDLELLVDSWKARHLGAEAHEIEDMTGEKFVKALAKQKPHAIAIGAEDLPFSVMTIMRAHQGEVFSTTGSENGLDAMDEASVLYAIEHLGVRHIPFVAPSTEKDSSKIAKMFDSWEKDLRSITVHGEKVVSNMLDEGKLAITRLRYDLNTGKLVQL